MKWVKRGIIFKPEGQFEWVVTHAMLPVADRLHGDYYRIYFSGRDKFNRSSIGYIEVNMKEPQQILHLSEEPVFGPGALGSFDDSGVTPTWIVNHQGKKFMYYLGWNKGSTVRASEVTGLAVSIDGGKKYQRVSRAPILHRTDNEPYSILVASSVMIEGNKWRMWYDSADEWVNRDLPRYNIKYAESSDGLNWTKRGAVAVDFKYPGESRISRACVLKEGRIYKMWYCYAIGTGGYRMGYAESENGIDFQRKDKQVGIGLSRSGWDSEMVCYPYVFEHNGQKYMLYCGNGYGKTGFGYAVLDRG